MTLRITFRWHWRFLGQSPRRVSRSEKHAKEPYVGTFEELTEPRCCYGQVDQRAASESCPKPRESRLSQGIHRCPKKNWGDSGSPV